MFTLEYILYTFADSLTGYGALTVCLFAVMNERGWQRLKKLPVLLACAPWTRWAWRAGFWRAFAAVCMAGVFQVAVSTLSWMLLRAIPLDRAPQFLITEAVFWSVVLTIAILLYRLLLEDVPGQSRTALLLFVLEASMETLLLLQNSIQPDLAVYYFLVITPQRG